MTAESGFHREDVAEYVHALVAKARGEASSSTDEEASSDDDEDADDEAESARKDLARSTGEGAPAAAPAPAAAGVHSGDAAAMGTAEATESKWDTDSSSEGLPALRSKGSTALSAQLRAVEIEEHRAAYVGAKKGLQDFRRELTLVQRFVELNAQAVRKIVKKFSKVAGSDAERDAYMAKQDADEDFAFFEGKELAEQVARVDALLATTLTMRPLNSNWQHTRVYTVGCFDLAHRGHENLFRSLREYGRYLVVGLHDDASYFKLKRKHTIDNLEKRIENIKPFCDQVFVIPSTDPTPFLRAMVSDQDVKDGSCCYVRGADMPQFPGRSYVECVMPVYLLPRSEGVSSSLVRAIYHSAADDDADMVQARAMAAAFAPQDAAGKPLVTDDLIEAELEKLQRKRELTEIARASKAAAVLEETGAPAAAAAAAAAEVVA
jgi:cytidyltransferase-like protein